MVELSNFKPEKQFFIGIDSDGTAFDSMTIKHTDSFIPMIFKIWGMEDKKEEICELEEFINLYSKLRGINRFPGLLLLFKELKKRGIFNRDLSAFEEFCDSGVKMSNASLTEFIKTHDDKLLGEVLDWSRGSDELFSKGTESLRPFPSVAKALEKASEFADIVIVSSASAEGLKTDWERGGILKYVTCLCGQEAGSKKEQLKASALGNYDSDKILMLGDALGDMDATKAVGAHFYPIIPKCENECWDRLISEGLEKFKNGSFSGDYEQSLIEKFDAGLPEYNL